MNLLSGLQGALRGALARVAGLADSEVELEVGEERRVAPARGHQPARVALAAVGILAGAAVLVLTSASRRRRSGGPRGDRNSPAGRIPLKDVIRFKERQWFVEELESSRDGDANSMLRLAKMYLHGQGCQRNVAMAQEWLRKARTMGVGATLDEIYATDDPDPRGKLRTLLAEDEKRRAARKAAGSYASMQQLDKLRYEQPASWRPAA